ncbi:DUF3891 family protein [Pseudalkalibacillus hwajinpoensis]|uniref:DUF3891 family protein n=1 Tax=Guptibacillus hwajinpoensis TaxID=208199 RepID=UPI00325B98E8
MIVYEHGNSVVMIKQHDHALLSGQFARELKMDYWPDLRYREEVLFAIKHHDRGWIDLDEVPFWNDRQQAPYSFLDFPLAPKLTFYRKGIEEVKKQTFYGSFLCSKHYQSFFNGANANQALAFYEEEQRRQQDLEKHFDISDPLLTFHYQLLQFCDDLSLFACFQEPGVAQEDEIKWYKDGFPQHFHFLHHNEKVVAHWHNEKSINLSHPLFPEGHTFEVQIKQVSNDLIKSKGIANAYQSTSYETRTFQFNS